MGYCSIFVSSFYSLWPTYTSINRDLFEIHFAGVISLFNVRGNFLITSNDETLCYAFGTSQSLSMCIIAWFLLYCQIKGSIGLPLRHIPVIVAEFKIKFANDFEIRFSSTVCDNLIMSPMYLDFNLNHDHDCQLKSKLYKTVTIVQLFSKRKFTLYSKTLSYFYFGSSFPPSRVLFKVYWLRLLHTDKLSAKMKT